MDECPNHLILVFLIFPSFHRWYAPDLIQHAAVCLMADFTLFARLWQHKNGALWRQNYLVSEVLKRLHQKAQKGIYCLCSNTREGKESLGIGELTDERSLSP